MIRHPRKTLEYVDQTGGRAWVIMALLADVSAVFLVAAVAPISARIAQEAIQTQLQSQLGASPGSDDAEMQARISQFATNPLLTIVAPSLTGVIGILIGWLVWAGALHLFSVMVGGDSHFGSMWRGVEQPEPTPQAPGAGEGEAGSGLWSRVVRLLRGLIGLGS
jgi:hypothetical protein